MEFGVSKSLESLSTLLFGNEALALEVVESENILELRVLVDNTPVSLDLSCFEALDEAAFNVIWLLVS